MSILEQLAGRVQALMEKDRQKIGGMTFSASARLGLEELRQAVALDGSVADQTQTPLGMYGTLTPGEVSSARTDSAEWQEQNAVPNDVLNEARRQAEAQRDSGSDTPGHGAGR